MTKLDYEIQNQLYDPDPDTQNEIRGLMHRVVDKLFDPKKFDTKMSEAEYRVTLKRALRLEGVKFNNKDSTELLERLYQSHVGTLPYDPKPKGKERLFSDLNKARAYAKKTGMKVHNTGDFFGYISPVTTNTPFLVKFQDMGTLKITGSKPKMQRLKKHLEQEHPSTRGHMRVDDPKNPHIPTKKEWEEFEAYKQKIAKKLKETRGYDIKTYVDIPARWYEAMVLAIKKRKDVRNPYEIVKNIWKGLPAEKKLELIQREASGEQFHYDLPLPKDLLTKGKGILRLVKRFRLAEAQVNVSAKDMEAVKKSGIFKPMKRDDGSVCQVARCKCKGQSPVNVFVDEIGGK